MGANNKVGKVKDTEATKRVQKPDLIIAKEHKSKTSFRRIFHLVVNNVLEL